MFQRGQLVRAAELVCHPEVRDTDLTCKEDPTMHSVDLLLALVVDQVDPKKEDEVLREIYRRFSASAATRWATSPMRVPDSTSRAQEAV